MECTKFERTTDAVPVPDKPGYFTAGDKHVEIVIEGNGYRYTVKATNPEIEREAL